jgi:hypothetical protein
MKIDAWDDGEVGVCVFVRLYCTETTFLHSSSILFALIVRKFPT